MDRIDRINQLPNPSNPVNPVHPCEFIPSPRVPAGGAPTRSLNARGTVSSLEPLRVRPLDARVGDGARVADAEVLDILEDEGRHVRGLLRGDAEEGRAPHVFEVEGGAQVFGHKADLDVGKLDAARVANEEAIGR